MKKIIIITSILLLSAGCQKVKTTENQNKPEPQGSNYYQDLKKQCGSDSCCLSSVNYMEKGSYELVENGVCPTGMFKNMYRCITSKQWCEPEKPTTLPQGEKEGWQTYTNNEFKFQISLPPVWKNYKVSLQEMSSNFGAGTLLFQLPTKSKIYKDNNPNDGYATAMRIYIYNLSYWGILNKDEGPKPGVLGENANYIFAYSFWQDPPEDWVGIGPDSDQIVSTFKFFAETAKLKTCPNSWIQNDMPAVKGSPESRQYYILKEQRKELSEFDNDWVKKNCKLQLETVY